MNQQQMDEIQLWGANAARRGETKFDNPYYKRVNMPITTGESSEIWNKKAELWQLGFEIEIRLMSPTDRQITQWFSVLGL